MDDGPLPEDDDLPPRSGETVRLPGQTLVIRCWREPIESGPIESRPVLRGTIRDLTGPGRHRAFQGFDALVASLCHMLCAEPPDAADGRGMPAEGDRP